MSTGPPLPPPASPCGGGAGTRQCVAAAAAAVAACLAPLAVLLAVLVLAPSLLPRLLLRPHHVVPYVASAELRLLAFDAAASTVAYNLSATLRFDGAPGGLYAWRCTSLRAAPSYAGQRLGGAAALPGITRRGAGAGDARAAAWAGTQRVPAGRRARAVAAALARDRAEGWYAVRLGVATVQDGAESDFACVLTFPAASVARNGSASAAFAGGRCVDAVPGEI